MSDPEQLQSELEKIKQKIQAEIQSSVNESDLESIRIKYLGKKGEITSILKNLASVAQEKRVALGSLANILKKEAEEAIAEKKLKLETSYFEKIAQSEWIDITAEAKYSQKLFPAGHIHPLAQIQKEVEDIFFGMGFQILDGPEVETDYYNFTALNTPADHPARDMQDTFWTEDGNLLRTHTSAIQVRGMEKITPPFRVIAPGRVFRYETVDASHENTFYQVEGMMVDKNISVANLIYIMKKFLKEIFGKDLSVRLRPGYFPFVEPGFELDINCLICSGKGCAVCKQSGWLELLPCGLVHPKVLEYGKIDTKEYSGFAFGLGLNRLVMMRYGIDDIRWFQSGDLRFIRQF
jgi:phenylalanyl-tRNA synthetase alpha chain